MDTRVGLETNLYIGFSEINFDLTRFLGCQRKRVEQKLEQLR